MCVSPCAVNLSAWWSAPIDEGREELSSAAQIKHCIIDHLREIKFVCFATDVSKRNGPVQYLKSRHLPSQRFCSTSDGRVSEGWITKNLSKCNVISEAENTADVFVADTHGLHRGCPVSNGHRLVLQLHFSYSIFRAEILARPRIKLNRNWSGFRCGMKLNEHGLTFGDTYSKKKVIGCVK